jgi:hypothetical protein
MIWRKRYKGLKDSQRASEIAEKSDKAGAF